MTYYENCSIPKPESATKKKKQNGYKNKASRYCYYCKTAKAERHEVYGGNPNRQISIDHGFQVDLCPACHEEMQRNITERAQDRNQYWRQYYQELYEKKLLDAGISAKQARELWMLLIGKNYKEDIL